MVFKVLYLLILLYTIFLLNFVNEIRTDLKYSETKNMIQKNTKIQMLHSLNIMKNNFKINKEIANEFFRTFLYSPEKERVFESLFAVHPNVVGVFEYKANDFVEYKNKYSKGFNTNIIKTNIKDIEVFKKDKKNQYYIIKKKIDKKSSFLIVFNMKAFFEKNFKNPMYNSSVFNKTSLIYNDNLNININNTEFKIYQSILTKDDIIGKKFKLSGNEYYIFEEPKKEYRYYKKENKYHKMMIDLMYMILFSGFVLMFAIYYLSYMDKSKKELKNLADKDALTNAYNKRKFEELMNERIAKNISKPIKQSIIFFDIDWFRDVNNNHGHDFGDFVLKKFTGLIHKHVRDKDIFARWGGEEFALVLDGVGLKSAVYKAECLRKLIEKTSFDKIHITSSFGVVEIDPVLHRNSASVLKEVDEYLYMAKNDGRNNVKSALNPLKKNDSENFSE